MAGAAVAGPVGAAAGAALGSLIRKPVQGQLRLELRYTSLRAERRDAIVRRLEELRRARAAATAAAGGAAAPPPGAAAADDEAAAADDEAAAATWQATLATRRLAKGGSEGVDWSAALAPRRHGRDGRERRVRAVLLHHAPRHVERGGDLARPLAAARRDRVRGTSDIVDVTTDANFIQTPLGQGFKGQKSDRAQGALGLLQRRRAPSRGA